MKITHDVRQLDAGQDLLFIGSGVIKSEYMEEPLEELFDYMIGFDGHGKITNSQGTYFSA